MGVGVLLRPPPLLLLLLLGLQGQVLEVQAQACSVDNGIVNIKENTTYTEPLVNITVPDGQQVTIASSTPDSAFEIRNNQLFLKIIPDYEVGSLMQVLLDCRRGDTVVTQLRVFVTVDDINDNPPNFGFNIKDVNVSEDTKVNSIVIPETELKAEDLDKIDTLFYTLQEVTPGTTGFFSLVGINNPALRLDKQLEFDKCQKMTFHLVVRDTQAENVEPSYTATATLIINVLPADLRPPWFLPCSYSDNYVCVQAQYQGAVPTGHRLPSPLILHPGPIYAVDGDRAINQPIIYSIINGNQDGVFSINESSGNLTMTKGISRPMTFKLVVKGEQADLTKYSVTQVSVEAQGAAGGQPSFPQSLYRGTVAPNLNAGAVVRDAANPSQALRLQAKDPDFPNLNSAITYNITNHSDFRMEGETVVTTVILKNVGVIYVEVEANNTVTLATATTVVEIQVREQFIPTGEPPGSPTPSEAGVTTGPSSIVTSEGLRPPGSSQGPSTSTSGGGTGPFPPSGTTLRPPASPTPGGTPSVGTSMSPSPAIPSIGGSPTTTMLGPSRSTSPGSIRPPGSTRPPGPSQTPSTTTSGGTTGPHPPSGTTLRPPVLTTSGSPPSVGASTSPTPAMPSTRSSAPTTSLGPSQMTPSGSARTTGSSGGGHSEDQLFSVAEMAVLGGVLGGLLLLALLVLGLLIYKHHRHRFKCSSGKSQEPLSGDFDNQSFETDEGKVNWEPAPSPAPSPIPAKAQPPSPEPQPEPEPEPRALPSPTLPTTARAEDSPAAVRSILTKERRPEGGYKAVWFGEDIGAEADVVVLNVPTMDDAEDSGSEGSADEDTDPGPARDVSSEPNDNSTYVYSSPLSLHYGAGAAGRAEPELLLPPTPGVEGPKPRVLTRDFLGPTP
ncbi:PREDICTED: cadherin-related family member 5 [Chrysochloris asiatica]|uniref:Cadherin-related family member 5 n=1 Tax=Chrysochloris asiatica TaxID=185453 RepID=A0A9B0X2R1_CHRAS|nr:PREDICTED: cadherin-related family member 5 [Chrysochloris asiatica]